MYCGGRFDRPETGSWDNLPTRPGIFNHVEYPSWGYVLYGSPQ